MVIDAKVTNVQQSGRDLIITIKPNSAKLGGWKEIIVKNFTHVPQIGQSIHGTSSRVTIEPGMGVNERWIYLHREYFDFWEARTH